ARLLKVELGQPRRGPRRKSARESEQQAQKSDANSQKQAALLVPVKDWRRSLRVLRCSGKRDRTGALGEGSAVDDRACEDYRALVPPQTGEENNVQGIARRIDHTLPQRRSRRERFPGARGLASWTGHAWLGAVRHDRRIASAQRRRAQAC